MEKCHVRRQEAEWRGGRAEATFCLGVGRDRLGCVARGIRGGITLDRGSQYGASTGGSMSQGGERGEAADDMAVNAVVVGYPDSPSVTRTEQCAPAAPYV